MHLSAVIVGGTCVRPLSYPLVLHGHSGVASACTKVPKYRVSASGQSFHIYVFFTRLFGHVHFVQLSVHPLLPKV